MKSVVKISKFRLDKTSSSVCMGQMYNYAN